MAAVQDPLHLPPGLEFGLLDEFFLPTLEEMTEQPGAGWSLDSPYETLSLRSDVAKSPGKASHSPSSGGSAASHSPGAGSQVLTPASTSLLDFSDAVGVEDHSSDMMSGSPSSNVSPLDGFVHVRPAEAHEARARHRSGIHHHTRPPPPGSGASSSTQPSHASRESSVSHPTHGSGGPWPSFASSPTVLMDGQQSGHHGSSYHLPNDMLINAHGFPAGVADELLSNMGEFDNVHYSYQTSDALPFRTLPDGSVVQTGYQAAAVPSRHPSTAYPQHSSADASNFDHSAHYQPFVAGSAYSTAITQHPQLTGFPASSFAFPTEAQVVPSPSQQQQQQQQQHHHPSSIMYDPTTTGAVTPGMVIPSNVTTPSAARMRRSPYPQPPSAGNSSQSPSDSTPASTQGKRNASSSASARYQTLVKAGPSAGSATLPRSGLGVTKARRGGRIKNSHLDEDSRAKSHEMRKVGACWRCVMQRDPCDHGAPCSRCQMRSQKGQQYFFDCDRSKLPDFVHDFLPPSMTVMHQKQSIEDCVNTQVLEWVPSSGMDVYLNSGYGPPLRWHVYEFKPRTEELLWQLQYFQDPATGQSQRHQKYSPPFGLMKIDTSDSEHFETYLNNLLNPEHLWDFGWSCYEEESQVDEEGFQAQLLNLMCELYQKTTDNELKGVLRDILRMMVITYIMGHTLTIAHDTLYTVISSVQHSSRPPRLQPFTSPRLANRQLKFFFAIQRDNIYKNVLRWQQATLHQAGKKESTWLSTFCVMLGFAMVLEEVQRTLQIQADAKADKGEMSPAAATTEAFNACDRIDTRFKLLVGLFQCKYRDKKWGENGSFGPGTPELRDSDAKEFLSNLRKLVEARQDHLRSRENVTFSPENQCLYTTRLTARFLLPFLSLPQT